MHEYCSSQQCVVPTLPYGFLGKLRGYELFQDNLHSVPDLGKFLKFRDCPGDSGTVKAYDFMKMTAHIATRLVLPSDHY